MKQILPHYLWVGHADDGRHFQQLFDAGVQAVVQLAAEEPPLQPPRELIYCRFPLLDGPGNPAELLSLAVHTVAGLLRRHVPTLVCCGGGLGRSPAVAAAALSVVQGMKPEECLEKVAEHTPTDVLPALWADLKGLLESERF